MKRDLFWKLLEPEHSRAEAFCRRLAGNRQDGDDLYQESLLKALDRIGSLRKIDSFRPWIYRIIVNNFKSRSRSPWRRKRESLEFVSSGETVAHDPSDNYAAKRWLERAMRPLSSEDRALVTLFEIDGWGVNDLGAMFGKPAGTIKSRLSRARARMRAELAKHLSPGNEEKRREGGKICVAGKQNVD